MKSPEHEQSDTNMVDERPVNQERERLAIDVLFISGHDDLNGAMKRAFRESFQSIGALNPFQENLISYLEEKNAKKEPLPSLIIIDDLLVESEDGEPSGSKVYAGQIIQTIKTWFQARHITMPTIVGCGDPYFFQIDPRAQVNFRINPPHHDFDDIRQLGRFSQQIRKEIIDHGTTDQANRSAEFYAGKAGEVFDERATFTADTEQELEMIEAMFSQHRVKQVLDVGVGQARVAIPLAEHGYQVTGVDITSALIDQAKQKPGGEKVGYLIGDARQLPIRKNSQDAVLMLWHTFGEQTARFGQSQVLQEIYRVLRRGGQLILDLPDPEDPHYRELIQAYREHHGQGSEDSYMYEFVDDHNHVMTAQTMRKDQIERLLSLSGFKNISIHEWTTSSGIKKFTIHAMVNKPL